MRIVIDARLYGPKTAKGLGRYLEQLLLGLKEQDQINDYVVLLSAENFDEFTATPRFKKVLAPWRWYSLAEQFYLPRLIKKLKPDLVHFPHFNVPLWYRGKFIVTIHDVLLRRHHSRRASTLGPLKFWLKKQLYLWVIGSAIHRAQKIITVSEFTKQEILHFYPVSASKISVIYEGLTKLEKTGENLADKEALLRYNITKPYLLYVGNAYPHKNLDFLLRAWPKIGQFFSGRLVLVGREDYFYQQLKNLVTKLGLGHSVVFLGYVPDADLAALYRSAELYVFPSLYEGFGLPLLEAMNYGLPIVASDTPCLKEIAGGAAEYFNPQAPDDLVEKIKNLLANQDRQNQFRQKGQAQCQKYRWPETVAEHLKIYHDFSQK